MRMRLGLLREVVQMALDSVRANKMRSALTVLGVVIGVMSIVGMTSLVQGLDQSLRSSIEELGPRTVFVARFSGLSFGSGEDLMKILRRPNLTIEDGKAIEKLPSIAAVDVSFGNGGPPTQERISYRGTRTKLLSVVGTTDKFPLVAVVKLDLGRWFTQSENQRHRAVAVLGQTPYQVLFGTAGMDPIGKKVRIGVFEYTVIGVSAARPSPAGIGPSPDDIIIIPETAYRRQYGIKGASLPFGGGGRMGGGGGMTIQSMMISALPRPDVSPQQAIADVENLMRIRRGLKLDDANNFDVMSQDVVMKMFDQISNAIFMVLLAISSIALIVGGIGVMAIMMISVTERTREIGVRKALGARRREILMQFLTEAATLTSVGGIIGIALGAAIGYGIHLATGFPLSLPWWSFAIGLGFSVSVGVFFGVVPAVRASRLNPIEALRYE
jgi:putative ABC transport system permease protein